MLLASSKKAVRRAVVGEADVGETLRNAWDPPALARKALFPTLEHHFHNRVEQTRAKDIALAHPSKQVEDAAADLANLLPAQLLQRKYR